MASKAKEFLDPTKAVWKRLKALGKAHESGNKQSLASLYRVHAVGFFYLALEGWSEWVVKGKSKKARAVSVNDAQLLLTVLSRGLEEKSHLARDCWSNPETEAQLRSLIATFMAPAAPSALFSPTWNFTLTLVDAFLSNPSKPPPMAHSPSSPLPSASVSASSSSSSSSSFSPASPASSNHSQEQDSSVFPPPPAVPTSAQSLLLSLIPWRKLDPPPVTAPPRIVPAVEPGLVSFITPRGGPPTTERPSPTAMFISLFAYIDSASLANPAVFKSWWSFLLHRVFPLYVPGLHKLEAHASSSSSSSPSLVSSSASAFSSSASIPEYLPPSPAIPNSRSRSRSRSKARMGVAAPINLLSSSLPSVSGMRQEMPQCLYPTANTPPKALVACTTAWLTRHCSDLARATDLTKPSPAPIGTLLKFVLPSALDPAVVSLSDIRYALLFLGKWASSPPIPTAPPVSELKDLYNADSDVEDEGKEPHPPPPPTVPTSLLPGFSSVFAPITLPVAALLATPIGPNPDPDQLQTWVNLLILSATTLQTALRHPNLDPSAVSRVLSAAIAAYTAQLSSSVDPAHQGRMDRVTNRVVYCLLLGSMSSDPERYTSIWDGLSSLLKKATMYRGGLEAWALFVHQLARASAPSLFGFDSVPARSAPPTSTRKSNPSAMSMSISSSGSSTGSVARTPPTGKATLFRAASLNSFDVVTSNSNDSVGRKTPRGSPSRPGTGSNPSPARRKSDSRRSTRSNNGRKTRPKQRSVLSPTRDLSSLTISRTSSRVDQDLFADVLVPVMTPTLPPSVQGPASTPSLHPGLLEQASSPFLFVLPPSTPLLDTTTRANRSASIQSRKSTSADNGDDTPPIPAKPGSRKPSPNIKGKGLTRPASLTRSVRSSRSNTMSSQASFGSPRSSRMKSMNNDFAFFSDVHEELHDTSPVLANPYQNLPPSFGGALPGWLAGVLHESSVHVAAYSLPSLARASVSSNTTSGTTSGTSVGSSADSDGTISIRHMAAEDIAWSGGHLARHWTQSSLSEVTAGFPAKYIRTYWSRMLDSFPKTSSTGILDVLVGTLEVIADLLIDFRYGPGSGPLQKAVAANGQPPVTYDILGELLGPILWPIMEASLPVSGAGPWNKSASETHVLRAWAVVTRTLGRLGEAKDPIPEQTLIKTFTFLHRALAVCKIAPGPRIKAPTPLEAVLTNAGTFPGLSLPGMSTFIPPLIAGSRWLVSQTSMSLNKPAMAKSPDPDQFNSVALRALRVMGLSLQIRLLPWTDLPREGGWPSLETAIANFSSTPKLSPGKTMAPTPPMLSAGVVRSNLMSALNSGLKEVQASQGEPEASLLAASAWVMMAHQEAVARCDSRAFKELVNHMLSALQTAGRSNSSRLERAVGRIVLVGLESLASLHRRRTVYPTAQFVTIIKQVCAIAFEVLEAAQASASSHRNSASKTVARRSALAESRELKGVEEDVLVADVFVANCMHIVSTWLLSGSTSELLNIDSVHHAVFSLLGKSLVAGDGIGAVRPWMVSAQTTAMSSDSSDLMGSIAAALSSAVLPSSMVREKREVPLVVLPSSQDDDLVGTSSPRPRHSSGSATGLPLAGLHLAHGRSFGFGSVYRAGLVLGLQIGRLTSSFQAGLPGAECLGRSKFGELSSLGLGSSELNQDLNDEQVSVLKARARWFVIDGSALISLVRMDPVHVGGVEGVTRIFVRDSTGKHVWDVVAGSPFAKDSIDNGNSPSDPMSSDKATRASQERSSSVSSSGLSAGAPVLPESLYRESWLTGESAPTPAPPRPPSMANAVQDGGELEKELESFAAGEARVHANGRARAKKSKSHDWEAGREAEPLFHLPRSVLMKFGLLGMPGGQSNPKELDDLRSLVWLTPSQAMLRAIRDLDSVPAREAFKVGLLYVGRDQNLDQESILGNSHGSAEYDAFVEALGWRVELATHQGYLGRLDRHGTDGQTAVYYGSSSVEVMFHDVTRMPTVVGDKQQIRKKRHVGNDGVRIVWTDAPGSYDVGTITSQFNDAHIIVHPVGNGLVRIRIAGRAPGLAAVGPLLDGHVVESNLAAELVRETAVNISRLVRRLIGGYGGGDLVDDERDILFSLGNDDGGPAGVRLSEIASIGLSYGDALTPAQCWEAMSSQHSVVGNFVRT